MFGRSWCLPAVVLLVCASLGAQSNSTPDFGFPIIAPRPLPPTVGPGGKPILPPTAPPGTFGFQQLADAAGAIFAGTVKSVARQPPTSGQAIETVTITFHVEEAIRGATPGDDFTISQWMGAWSSGQRYRVGERLLVFLYPPSKLGLTSCVGGSLGRFNVDGIGHVLLTAQHLSAFRTDPVLGGRSRVRFSDFALAVKRASPER